MSAESSSLDCLQVLVEQRATAVPAAAPTPTRTASTVSTPRRSLHDGSSFFTLDLGSLMGRDSSKSPKYPEKLIKVMDATLQRIAMRQEPKYSEQRFRRTAALFWSSQWADKTFQRQMRESRKVEDLILAFVTVATKALKKDEELAEGAWKWELNVQILTFLNLISDSVASLGIVGGELGNRLESYKTRLSTLDPPQPPEKTGIGVASASEDNASIKSVKREEGLKGDATVAVGKLFGLTEDTLQIRLKGLQAVCTEQAALEDLKTCLLRLNTDTPFPFGPNDFADANEYTAWRSNEVSTLSQMMLLMMQTNPALLQSSDKPNGDLTARLEGIKIDKPIEKFIYIPADPRAAYRELLAKCLEYDLEAMKTLPEDQEVSLGILMQEHVALLGECAVRWRLNPGFRCWVFLAAMEDRFELGEVPVDCVYEAMGMVNKVKGEVPLSSWAIPEFDGLEKTMLRLQVFFLGSIEQALSARGGYLSPEFQEAVENYRNLDPTESRHPKMDIVNTNIIEGIRGQAFKTYIKESSDRIDHEGGKNRAYIVAMAGWIESNTKKMNKRFGDPINEKVDLVALVLTQHLNLWMRDLEDAMMTPVENAGSEEEIGEALGIYKRARKLIDMGNAFSSEPMHFQMEASFEPTIRGWLEQTAEKTKFWADNALAVDDFAPTTENGPSSSVQDLFDSFRSAATFIADLNWPDERQLAVFSTRLAKIFSLSIDDYCNKMEQLFLNDMRSEVESVQSTAHQKAWIEKAKSTLAGWQQEKKIQAFFNFTPASCVKLNNIEAARQLLDALYREMRVDELAAYELSEPLPTPDSQRYLFTIKIVLAEGLTLDGSSKLPDSFVILSDEHGNRYAKTRTIYDDSDPRWDETFDIPVRGSAWFMATVRHRTLGGKHDLLGRSYLRLDPNQYMDMISKDVPLTLDSRGHLLLRISMEGEREDIQFHFGRAFRWLKRTESDMVRIFVDKMTPVLRHSLSRVTIKSVLKPGSSNSIATTLDYNEALGKLSAAYRNAIGTTPDYSIPPPPPEKPRNRGPTDAEIEAAIHPLFDYLDANNHTLSSTLSQEAMQMVMAKLWKQILMTIEALIVPPLSDKPSHMRALSDGELDIALRWLKFLRDFLYVGGNDGGVPLSVLQNQKFNEILSVRIYYDWKTDDLMEECIRGFQSTLKYKATKPSKSILFQRNLGTIKARKSAKKNNMNVSGNNTEMIMRILRMRSGTQEFLAQQLATISAVKLENPGKKVRSINRMGR
ncbi:hypothetical protein P7C73_g321, partial [Tremellales sp. Uapishka_1]